VAGELRHRYQAWVQAPVAAAERVLGGALVGGALFGSVARQTPHEGSDIDLLLVADPLPSGRAARRRVADRIEGEAADLRPDLPAVSLVLRTPAEVRDGFPLLLDIVAEGVVVADPSGAVAALLAGWRQRLAAQGARRVVTGESWHWDLAGAKWREGGRL
jgi:predicted nucleotidyltransferase